MGLFEVLFSSLFIIDITVDDIFDTLDDFLPILEGELFGRYAMAYCNMLNLYKHETNKIFEQIKRPNTLLMRNQMILNMLKKHLQASNNKNIINEKKINSNNTREEPYSNTILESSQSNEIKI